MADLSGNPWNFVPADVATSTTITSIVRNGVASALITVASTTGIVQDQFISVQGTTVVGWRGGYRVLVVPSATTLLVGITPQQSLLANNGANGNVLTAAYMQDVDVTQILWDSPTINGVLSLTDLTGRTVWNPTAVSGGTLTYAKVFPITGLVINALPSGTVQISV